MADTQDTNEPQGSPFSRPAFVVAGVLVLAIVLLGIIVAVRVSMNTEANNAAAQPPPTPPISSAATPTEAPSTPSDPAASLCGLPGTAGGGTVTSAPPAAWEYEDTTAYPTSREFGPGKTASENYRYCFQHSPTGAIFATANAVAQGTSSDVAKIEAWADYFVSDGTGREKLLSQLNEPRSDTTGIRMTVVGFKVLSYGTDTARVDLAVETSGSAQTVYASAVYELIWQEGDWKLNSDAAAPFDFGTVPNVNGYVPWGA